MQIVLAKLEIALIFNNNPVHFFLTLLCLYKSGLFIKSFGK